MESYSVISNENIIQIIVFAMFCCCILAPFFQYFGHRDAIDNYKKGIARKVIPWVLLCVMLCEIGLLGYQLYLYPWSIEPQPSQASIYRQTRSMCEYPLWGFANDYQLPIIKDLAGVVFWICWTVYAFSYKPSATSWWKKACKIIAYILLSAIILGFQVHELRDFLFYGVALFVVFVLLKIAHVRTSNKQKIQLSAEGNDDNTDNTVPQSDIEESLKETDKGFMSTTIPLKKKSEETITDSNDQHIVIDNKVNANITNDFNKVDIGANNTDDVPCDSTFARDNNSNKGENGNIIYCKFCGKKISADSVYCRYCGKKL